MITEQEKQIVELIAIKSVTSALLLLQAVQNISEDGQVTSWEAMRLAGDGAYLTHRLAPVIQQIVEQGLSFAHIKDELAEVIDRLVNHKSILERVITRKTVEKAKTAAYLQEKKGEA